MKLLLKTFLTTFTDNVKKSHRLQVLLWALWVLLWAKIFRHLQGMLKENAPVIQAFKHFLPKCQWLKMQHIILRCFTSRQIYLAMTGIKTVGENSRGIVSLYLCIRCKTDQKQMKTSCVQLYSVLHCFSWELFPLELGLRIVPIGTWVGPLKPWRWWNLYRLTGAVIIPCCGIFNRPAHV